MELVILLFLPCHLLAHIILGFESISPSFSPTYTLSLSLAFSLSHLVLPLLRVQGQGGRGFVQKWVKLQGEQWTIVIRK